MKTITCDMCGEKGARIHRTTRPYGKGKAEFLIRDVPVIVCPHCGESYLTAQTLREIERIKLHHRQLVVDETIPVAQFEGSASY